MSKRVIGFLVLATCISAIVFLLKHDAPKREFPADWYWDDEPKQAHAHAALEGNPMPGLYLSDWVNGEINLADLRGKVVLIDLYATWCGPCVALVPHNNELSKKFAKRGVLLFGVCTSESGQERMAETAAKTGMIYPTAKDPELKTQKAWGVFYYPTYAAVDRKGIVRAVGIQPEHVEQVIEKLLAEKPE